MVTFIIVLIVIGLIAGLSIHSFHTVGIIGSIIGAFVLLLLLRVTGLERGHRR
jgi:uncharacterized membrane protein YeaQ/YmgE (transglycosylase-associated protein family)